MNRLACILSLLAIFACHAMALADEYAWGSIKFGMSKAEVEKAGSFDLIGEKATPEGKIVYDKRSYQIGIFSYDVKFTFDGDKLTRISMNLQNRQSEDIKEAFQEIRSELWGRFGIDGVFDAETFAEYDENAEEYYLSMQWAGETALITLTMQSEDEKTGTLSLVYAPRPESRKSKF